MCPPALSTPPTAGTRGAFRKSSTSLAGSPLPRPCWGVTLQTGRPFSRCFGSGSAVRWFREMRRSLTRRRTPKPSWNSFSSKASPRPVSKRATPQSWPAVGCFCGFGSWRSPICPTSTSWNTMFPANLWNWIWGPDAAWSSRRPCGARRKREVFSGYWIARRPPWAEECSGAGWKSPC